MKVDLAKHERAFRSSWREYAPHGYAAYLKEVSEAQRVELLARLLSVELEFAFMPPSGQAMARALQDNDDDQRIKPCIQLFLLRFPELKSTPELLIRLIVLEYALRLRYDSSHPNPASYLPLCDNSAEFSQERLAGLLELTERKLSCSSVSAVDARAVGHTDSTIKDCQISESIRIDPLPLSLGCFLLLRMLGRGGMGFVHSAVDLRSTAQVAVKIMRRTDAWSVYRFNEEFRWLSQLSHPNLIKLYDAYCEGQLRYFSMELVEGRTIREWFKRQSTKPGNRWTELQRVLAQLASAIHYLHEHGVIHCDVKSSNMMIASGGRAVLLDLGLAIRVGQDSRLVGTLQYMAPEISQGHPATYASDWYSFGAMICEVITDSLPSPSLPGPQVISAHDSQHNDRSPSCPDSLLDRLGECPEDLAKLCLELVQADPQHRPLGADVVGRLSGRNLSQHSFGHATECIGRTTELAQMNAAVGTGTPHQAQVCLLRGQSGIGKSSLLRSWEKQLAPQGFLLLPVRCYQQDHTPVRLLNAIVQELASVCARLDATCWEPKLESKLDEISLLFPQVQQLVAESMESSLRGKRTEPTDSAREASLAALIEWLLELSHAQRLVISVDDAQWADTESLRGLVRLVSHSRKFQGSLMLVDESEEQRLTDLFRPAESAPGIESAPYRLTQIRVGGLPPLACLAALEQWSRDTQVELPASVSTDICERSQGNPFLLQETFRAYLHYLQVGDTHAAHWLKADSQTNVRRRFGMLPQQAENALQYVAISDQSLSFHQLQMVSRILPHELQRALSLLVSQGWIRSWSSNNDSAIEIAHENFRNAVLMSIPAERLHRRHYRMARILSIETPPSWSRIAEHYWSAEHFREAATCYLEAARSAIAAASPEEAIAFLQRACHPDADRSKIEKLAVTRMEADCRARVGSSRRAAELYDSLLIESTDAEQALILRCLAGEQWIRAGQLEEGLSRLASALDDLGIASSKKSLFGQICLACRALRMGFKNPFRSRRSAASAEFEEFSEMERCLNRVTTPLTFLDNQLGPDLILRMDKLAENRGSNFDRALATLKAGILLSFGGRRFQRAAIQRLRLGRQLARNSRSQEARAAGDFCMYVWHAQRGRPLRAIGFANEALKKFKQCVASTQWEQQFIQWALLGDYWFIHRQDELVHSTTTLRASAHQRSDPMSLFWMHVYSAALADLTVDQTMQAQASLAIAEEAIANQSFQSPRFFLWLTRVHQALYANDAASAQSILLGDWKQLDRSLVLQTNHFRWLALSLRISCDMQAMRNRLPQADRYLRDARDCVRKMRKLEEKAFIEYSHAFSLTLDAAAGNVAAPAAWDEVADRLRSHGHCLMATALNWQQGIYASGAAQRDLCAQAEAEFRQQGCVSPEKIMDVILPLPHSR